MALPPGIGAPGSGVPTDALGAELRMMARQAVTGRSGGAAPPFRLGGLGGGGGGAGDDDDDEREEDPSSSAPGGGGKSKTLLRRERNREHARNSRERKRQRFGLLQDENDELRWHCTRARDDNMKLRELIQRLIASPTPPDELSDELERNGLADLCSSTGTGFADHHHLDPPTSGGDDPTSSDAPYPTAAAAPAAAPASDRLDCDRDGRGGGGAAAAGSATAAEHERVAERAEQLLDEKPPRNSLDEPPSSKFLQVAG